MKLVKLWVLTAFAILAFGAVGTAVASAESPALLCLEAGCVKELKGEFTAKEFEKDLPTLETLGLLRLTATEGVIKIKGCEPQAGTEEKDTLLCKDQSIVFTGVKERAKEVSCQTSGAAAGEIKALLDLHAAAELNKAGTELEPLLLAKVLGGATGSELVPGLKFKCSLLNFEVKGTIPCLMLPGLTSVAAGGEFKILCKIDSKMDPETGECQLEKADCESLKTDPFEATNAKGVFEDAWMLIHFKGTFNKTVFLDD